MGSPATSDAAVFRSPCFVSSYVAPMPRLRSALDARKEPHAALNEHVASDGSHRAVSTTMRFEALPGSPLPDDLRALGTS